MENRSKRAVVSVATGRYIASFDRLSSTLTQHTDADFVGWRGELPPGSPPHEDVPYAFKAYALSAAVNQGYSTVMWMDSSIVLMKPLLSLWELIEDQGYWFSENFPYGSFGPAWNCGSWTCDSALGPLGIVREETFGITHVIATSFGLDIRHPISRLFLQQYLALAEEKTAFCGPWINNNGEASSDPHVLGHRHDQTVASVLAWRLGMKLTQPPRWIVDGIPATKDTVLEIRRPVV